MKTSHPDCVKDDFAVKWRSIAKRFAKIKVSEWLNPKPIADRAGPQHFPGCGWRQIKNPYKSELVNIRMPCLATASAVRRTGYIRACLAGLWVCSRPDEAPNVR
jgi:hypothetical protein